MRLTTRRGDIGAPSMPGARSFDIVLSTGVARFLAAYRSAAGMPASTRTPWSVRRP
jgi:hypothetical protein